MSKEILTISDKMDVKNDIMHNWGFCGCGNPELVIRYVRDCLQALKDFSEREHEDKDPIEDICGSKASAHFMRYWIDRKDYADHSGNVGYLYLTPEGEELIETLNKYLEFDDKENPLTRTG